MENIKDYILKADANTVNTTVPAPLHKAKPKVSYETVFASGPDFAVRRKTPKTSMVMVVIVSKGQFYIKEESSGGAVHDLYEDNLLKFVTGIPDDGFTIRDAEGNSPNWIRLLQRDAYWRETFLRTIAREYLHPYMKNDMFDIELFLNNYNHPTLPDQDFSAVKHVFSIAAEYLGKEEARKTLFANGGLFHALFDVHRDYARGGVVDTPSSYSQINSRWGIEGVRKFLKMFFETPVQYFPEGSTFKNLFERFDPRKKYYAREERKPVCETVFDLQSMVDYMFCECTKQGYADAPSGFWSSWADYMDQQVLLFGEVRDKYSEQLASDEQILTYRCGQLKMQASKEAFQDASDYLSGFEYSHGPYCILAPKQPGDLVEEGRQLSHCVGSYADRVAARDTMIFFLRKTAEPDRSLVTVQVDPNGRLGQICGRFNRQPSPEQLRFVEKWHEKFFKTQEAAA